MSFYGSKKRSKRQFFCIGTQIAIYKVNLKLKLTLKNTIQ